MFWSARQLVYLDSLDVDFKTISKDFVHEDTPNILPRVKAWNEGLIKGVMKKDRIRKGVYGKLRVCFSLFFSPMHFFLMVAQHAEPRVLSSRHVVFEVDLLTSRFL